ncbi:MAG TPA: HAD hydrolase-like protein [Gaiellaceae bacterium]|nr:HAD hydrolase-like protein [Gaiellaceae bacterium]
MTVVLWDSLGTLLDLTPVRDRFPSPDGFEVWLERTLHTGVALSLAGEFQPFEAVAEAALPPGVQGALDALRHELRPHADAEEALDVLDAAGIESWVVTNGGRDATLAALARGGLEERFRGVVSIDDVQAWKPAREPYAEALHRAGAEPAAAWLVAAHAWDVHAAALHGLHAVWVDRLEGRWPLPVAEADNRAGDLPGAARIVAGPARVVAGPVGPPRP